MIGGRSSYGAFASVYDHLMSDMPYDDWIAWLETYWQAHGRPSNIVDLGCGTGSIAIPLAQSGLNVTGIDLSREMIAVAREKEAAFRKEVQIPGKLAWLQGDIREWRAAEPFDAAVSLCDCLNYLLTEDDLRQAFRRTYDGLAPGGCFLFDMHHANQLDEYMMHEPFCHDDELVSYLWNCELNEQTSTITHHLVFFLPEEDGRYKRVEETHRERAYSEDTVRRLLAEAGFTRVESFADFTFEPVDDDSTLRMFFAATRP